jgi:hypothetical protein
MTRVSVGDALHCAFAKKRHADVETFVMLGRIVERYGVHNISQAPSALPLGVWRALYRRFPDLVHSEHLAVRNLVAQFDAENAAAASLQAIESALNGSR